MLRAKRRHWRNLKPGKKDIKTLLLVPFYVLRKILMMFLRFMDFRYKIWVSIRTTNIIERVFREFRRRINTMDTSPIGKSLYQDNVLVS